MGPLRDDDGDMSYRKLKKATNELQKKLMFQEKVQKTMWSLVKLAYPDNTKARKAAWRERHPPRNAACEKGVRRALVRHCSAQTDMTTAYALQFHQVVVNLCADKELRWNKQPALGEAQAKLACNSEVKTVV